jgi:hypothetical protein
MRPRMVTVLYLAYGRKRFSQAFGGPLPLLERGDDVATAFSALTFLHYASTLAKPWRLVIYTDAPRVFERYSIPCEVVPVDVVRDREDTSGYKHRRKLLVVQHCAESFDGDVFFVDGDTYFMRSPGEVFDALASGRSVLHTRDAVVSDEAHLEVNRLMREHAFTLPRLQSAQRRPTLTMWSSGVIGLPEEAKPLIPEVIAVSDELWAGYPYHAMEQFAWSLVLEEATEIVTAEDVVYHYWHGREELTYRTVSFLRANGHLPLDELAAAAAAFRPTVSATWEPPLEVRARQLMGAAGTRLKRTLAKIPARPDPTL